MDRVDDGLAEEEDRRYSGERPSRPRPPPGQAVDQPERPHRGEHGEHRQERHQPATEPARRAAHEQHVDDHRGHEEPEGAAARAGKRDGPRQAGERRHPAEPPGDRPEVVEVAVGERLAELAFAARGAGLVDDPAAEALDVQQRVRAGDDEAGDRRRPGQAEEQEGAGLEEVDRPAVAALEADAPRVGKRPAVVAPAEVGGDADRDDEDRRGVLRRHGGARGGAGEGEVPPASVAVDAGDAIEGERCRRERRRVVEREVRVEDGHEGDGDQRGAQEADAAVAEELRAREVGPPDRQRAQDGADDACDDVDLGGVGGVGPRGCIAAAEPDAEDEVEQVRVARRVDEVERVEGVPEEPDRARDEVRVLVDVVGVGQALLDPPQAQAQADDHESGHGKPPAQPCSRRRARGPLRTGDLDRRHGG